MRQTARRTLVLILFCLLAFAGGENPLMAQGEGPAFLYTGRGAATTAVRDYQALGINPANIGLPMDGHSATLGFLEGGFAIYSDALRRSELRRTLFDPRNINLTAVQQELFSREFAEAGQTIQLDGMVAGFGLDLGKNGGMQHGIAVDVRGRISGNLQLNEFAAGLLFEGFDFENYFDTVVAIFGDTTGIATLPQQISGLFDPTQIGLIATFDVNVGWGGQVWSQGDRALYVGVGARYLQGAAYFDLRVEDGELQGFSSLSPGLIFELDSTLSPSALTGERYKPAGHGGAIDIGVHYVAGPWRVGASFTDLGAMRWTANVVGFNDFFLDSLAFSGITTTNIFDQLDEFIADQLLVTEGLEGRTAILPARFRAGAGYAVNEHLELGADVVLPLNRQPGNLQRPYISGGVDWCFTSVFHVSAGAAWGGNYDFRVPFGLTVRSERWEGGVATRDLLTLFGPNTPTLSLAGGFLRFKLGS